MRDQTLCREIVQTLLQVVLLWKLLWVKPPNCLIILWQIIHNGITVELQLVNKGNSVEEISSLSEKVDALVKLVASKSAPIDFNDMPLSTLIEQNSDAIDVNFISQNNSNNNAYRGNFNPRPFPSNSSNNYGNSYGNQSYNNNRNTSDLGNNIK